MSIKWALNEQKRDESVQSFHLSCVGILLRIPPQVQDERSRGNRGKEKGSEKDVYGGQKKNGKQ